MFYQIILVIQQINILSFSMNFLDLALYNCDLITYNNCIMITADDMGTLEPQW